MKQFNVFPLSSNFDFLRLRKLAFAVVIAMLVTAFSAMIFKGFNFALDFTGGTLTELRFERPVDVDDVRGRLEAAGYENAQVQTFGSGTDLRSDERRVGKEGGSTCNIWWASDK